MSENLGARPMVGRAKFWCVWLGSLIAFVLAGWLLTATWGVRDATRHVERTLGSTRGFEQRSPAPFVVVAQWQRRGRGPRDGAGGKVLYVWFLGMAFPVCGSTWRA